VAARLALSDILDIQTKFGANSWKALLLSSSFRQIMSARRRVRVGEKRAKRILSVELTAKLEAFGRATTQHSS